MINKDCEQHCYEYHELVTENAVLQVALKEAEELCAEYSCAVKPPFQNAGYRRSRDGIPQIV